MLFGFDLAPPTRTGMKAGWALSKALVLVGESTSAEKLDSDTSCSGHTDGIVWPLSHLPWCGGNSAGCSED